MFKRHILYLGLFSHFKAFLAINQSFSEAKCHMGIRKRKKVSPTILMASDINNNSNRWIMYTVKVEWTNGLQEITDSTILVLTKRQLRCYLFDFFSEKGIKFIIFLHNIY